MSIDLTRFHESFFTESLEGLDATEAHVLALESHVEARGGEVPGDSTKAFEERLNAVFRGFHSIKGAAGSLGFDAIAQFTHHVEEFLDLWRKGTAAVDRAGLDTVLACIDHARLLVRAARENAPPGLARSEELVRHLAKLSHVRPVPREEAAAAPALENAKATYRIHFRPGPESFRRGNDPLRLLRVLAEMGKLEVRADLAALPGEGDYDAERCLLAWQLTLVTNAPPEQVDDVFAWVRDESEIRIESSRAKSRDDRRRTDRRQVHRRVGPRRAEEPSEVAEELRTDRLHVSRDKVDELVNQVGELVITKTMLKQVALSLDPASIARLEAVLQQLERNTRELQDGVMGIRMLPMSHAFGRFARLVRDTSQRLGKEVRLEITGGDSELDKSMIEKLVDPLTHLVRNALDHGVEPPAERRDRGKGEMAVLSLHAQHRGGNIEIRVTDDGRGIDPERVERRAREAGLIREGEAVSLERATELIFEPGLSTAEQVNDLSGRGVGLDVVRKNIMALNGTLSVESWPGRGTAFVIRLPLTLAIIDGMVVTAGQDAYIVPLAYIIECLQPEPSKLKSIAGKGMLVDVRGAYLPLLELGRLTATAAGGYEESLLMVLEAEGNRIVLQVDALLGQEQVVIKSLEANYRKVPYIAGATILGEGRVVLILDVASLVRAARE
jgi:two-component system chemotaxis sensor kinase CheA